MWRTHVGERVLRGAEAAVFRFAIGSILSCIDHSRDDGEAFTVGVAVFDRLQASQQLAMLAMVAEAILDESVPCPELTSVSEGTVAAIYEVLKLDLEDEIDSDDLLSTKHQRTPVRRLVRSACRQVIGSSYYLGKLPAGDSADLEGWEDSVEFLLDRILWDRDIEWDDEAVDFSPELREHVFSQSGISPDYFLHVAPDPKEQDLLGIRQTIEALRDGNS